MFAADPNVGRCPENWNNTSDDGSVYEGIRNPICFVVTKDRSAKRERILRRSQTGMQSFDDVRACNRVIEPLYCAKGELTKVSRK